MFCAKCGKQINEGAAFCPFCGEKTIKNTHENNVGKTQEKTTIYNPVSLLKEWIDKKFTKILNFFNKGRNKKYTTILIAVVIIFIFAFPVRISIEKKAVKSVAEQYLQMVKDGPSAETLDVVVEQVLYEATENETITEYIHSKIDGQDIKDIYDALMIHFEYEVKEVERLGNNHYRITVHVENMDNSKVAHEAWSTFSARYKNASIIEVPILLKQDFSGDKSIKISGYLIDASNKLYDNGKNSNSIYGDHYVDVQKIDGEWIPTFEEGIEKFVFDSAGIPISDEDLRLLTGSY